MGASDDNRLGAILDEVGEGRGGIGHGIRAVADHKPIVLMIVLPDGRSNFEPVLRPDIRAVQAEKLQGIHRAETLHFRHILQNFPGSDQRGKAGAGSSGSDGSPCCDHENSFHTALLILILAEKAENISEPVQNI